MASTPCTHGAFCHFLKRGTCHWFHSKAERKAAEEAFAKNLSKLTGHQYELLQPDPNASDLYTQQSPLYTLRHVFRTSQTSVKVLGIYYVVEGVIYKSPPIRSLMKSNVARTLDGLAGKAREESIALGKLMATIPSFFSRLSSILFSFIQELVLR